MSITQRYWLIWSPGLILAGFLGGVLVFAGFFIPFNLCYYATSRYRRQSGTTAMRISLPMRTLRVSAESVGLDMDVFLIGFFYRVSPRQLVKLTVAQDFLIQLNHLDNAVT